MKKVLLSLLVLLMPLLMFGCQKNVTLEDSISEITKIYFSAETDGISANISVGEREENYIIDGNHTKNCDFSLISIKFDELLPLNQIDVTIEINEVSTQLILDLNPANHYYMTDLGYALKNDDKIKIFYQESELIFKNISDNFAVDYKQALKFGKQALSDKLDDFYDGKNFIGEVYLRILTEQNSENKQYFWVLTLVSQNNTKTNVVLNVENGEIIISE